MQSVYEAAGGDEGLLRLAEAWHIRVMADPIVSHAFSGGFHPQHSQRLAAYWAEALGGPAAYTASYGDETSVVRIHSGNGPHEEMDRLAIACFDQALADVGLTDEPLRRVLHDYFAWATNTTMSRYHDSAADVPDGLRLPRWSWEGLVDGDPTRVRRDTERRRRKSVVSGAIDAYARPMSWMVQELAEAVEVAAGEREFSGVVRVDREGKPAYQAAFGLAQRGHEVRNTVDTRFAVASGAKGFTALAVVRLIEQGRLALDTTARSVLGADLPLIDADVTVEHLLGHRSGIGDYLDEEKLGDSADYVLKSPVHQLADTEAFLVELDGYPTKFPAGTDFSYCNGGFVVLALIAERVSGTGYHQLVDELVCQPAGLADTAFLRSDQLPGRTATGYLVRDGEWRSNILHLPVRGNGDGGIYTTADDMSRFWRAFFDGRIVGKEWVTEMTRPHSVVAAEKARYGLGFWLHETGPQVSLIGGDAGVSFTSTHDPSTNVTWSVLGNTDNGAWPVARAIRSVLKEKDRG